MYTERALLDAREVRATLAHRADVLDEVKRLPLLPDGTHVTATLLAEYFEVDAVVLRRVVRKHAGELGGYGYRQLQGEELRAFVAVNLPESRVPRRHLGVFTVPAALVLAMVLEPSEIARAVRAELLESVGAIRGEADERPVMVRTTFPATGDPVRVVLFDGEPWFAAVDLCRVLGVENPSDVRKILDPVDLRKVAALDTIYGSEETAGQSVRHRDLPPLNLVSEAGLYTLILKSRKPAARPFQRWIVADLLPSIRRGDTGLDAHQTRMAETLAEAIGHRLHAVADVGHALDKDFTVMSEGTVHCRHGEMEICVPAPGEDSGPPFGPYYRCQEIERYGIRGSRTARPCGSVKFVDVVRRLSERDAGEAQAPEPRLRTVEAQAPDAGSMFMMVGSPEQIADVLRRGLPT
ncbi:BRO family protein [Streptomyces sp. NPDC048442]|uniref:BRO-N domain-containing protein n=1 Tax=Streptomyces sp. NPDC048442 TaxID=3154823 RepID=UPI00344196D0